jgi:urease accessory protein
LVIIEEIIGNVEDPIWAEKIAGAVIDSLPLDHWEAQKSRLRKRTAGEVEIAISLPRGCFLRDGDILLWDKSASRVVVANINMRDVMVIHLDALAVETPEIAMRTCVEIGHALGNQHWPALVKGTRIYVPLTVDHKVMASVMKTHRFENVRYEFVPGNQVVQHLAPHESRRLFGGAEDPVHKHSHESENLGRQAIDGARSI